MNLTISFGPYVSVWVLWTAGVICAALVIYAFARGARGAWARGIAFAVMILALAHPLIVHETREPLPDVAAIVVDHTQSMNIRGRRAEADAAAAQLKKQLSADKSLEVREAFVDTRNASDDTGTQLFSAITSALSDVPPDRIAGAIAITDGEVHDAPPSGKPALSAPVQALIVGKHNERDRKLTVVSATRYAIVGQQADIALRVDDYGGEGGAQSTEVNVHIDGVDRGTQVVPVGQDTGIKIPVAHAGENVVELEAKAGPAELTLQNNRAVVSVNGVRDRLRVLLVSGEPHAGERVWRSMLKADPSVDLVHFTILRPPDKQDATPIDELALIAFPHEDLFLRKLGTFDLVIFDRYSERGILPLGYYDNIVNYVQNGGALLVSSGPEFTGPQSIYRTPLATVLPAQPTNDIVTQPFKPNVTDAGFAHPVTRDLPGANGPDKSATWGKWFRLIGANVVAGETLMSGPDKKPLLVLDQVQKGRVAEILSDHIWLWARGYDGGGPDAELLRRLAHWLMKEPELEEERLTASVSGGDIAIDRHSMKADVPPVTITYPSGKKAQMTLSKISPGEWRGAAKADELGLYRLTDGTLTAVTAAGPLNPKEVSDMRATDAILKAPLAATGGGVHWLADGGIPSIRRTSRGSIASGDGWMGLVSNGAYRVTSVEQMPLLPAWLALLILIGTLMLAWRQEGK
ncbi:MAG TPA: hypothetical protein VGH02_04670 [Rhizomicrobium sp.]|jgi:hypothetical protein